MGRRPAAHPTSTLTRMPVMRPTVSIAIASSHPSQPMAAERRPEVRVRPVVVTATTGLPSASAHIKPATRLAAPGPAQAMTTAGWPVTRV